MSLQDCREMQVVMKVHSCLHRRVPAYPCSKFSRNLTLNIGKPGVPIVSNYNALTRTSTESPLSLTGLTYETNFPGLSSQSEPEKRLSRLFGSICLNLNNCCLFFLFILFCNPPCFVCILCSVDYVQDPQVDWHKCQ